MRIPCAFQGEPLIEQVDGDRTPVAVFEHLYGPDRHAFLYESMERLGQRGRYSMIGGRPGMTFQACRRSCRIITARRTTRIAGDPFSILEDMVEPGRRSSIHELFGGGAVGWVAYDAVRHIERIADENREDPKLPDFSFMFPTEIIVFDHREKSVYVICYRDRKRMREIVAALDDLRGHERQRAVPRHEAAMRVFMTRQEFCSIVSRAKEYIRKGDIFQVVLSRRLSLRTNMPPFRVYRNLRETNPSPYMYYVKAGSHAILGSSPETLVKLQDGRITSVPIAGTRPRGRDDAEDERLARDLIDDDKERAEHIMLVDLARNDVGRVSKFGSVTVPELMRIQKYSKVMHITSQVNGAIRPGRNAFDVFKAAFPAGTVSGAPKVRAMEIIDELETVRRGIYAGAIGYFGFDGNMDFCIAIRTIVIHDRIAYLQSGAGIVADSDPDHEYEETLYKMSALRHALENAL